VFWATHHLLRIKPMAGEDSVLRRGDIPLNSCMFVLEGGAYINDGCNCSAGYEPPPPPEVQSDPRSPLYVPCIPIEGDEGGQVRQTDESQYR
jgi:hypothetical protein